MTHYIILSCAAAVDDALFNNSSDFFYVAIVLPASLFFALVFHVAKAAVHGGQHFHEPIFSVMKPFE